jgi:transposase-like protein
MEPTVADVANRLGVAESLLHSWKKKHGSAAAQVRRERGGETAEEKLKCLRREITQVKQQRGILKNQSPSSRGTAREPARACPVGEGAIPGPRAVRGDRRLPQRVLRLAHQYAVKASGGDERLLTENRASTPEHEAR